MTACESTNGFSMTRLVLAPRAGGSSASRRGEHFRLPDQFVVKLHVTCRFATRVSPIGGV
jgi:hypothetical protein